MPPRADGSPLERATSHRFSANESRSASFGIGVDGRALQEAARTFSLNRWTGKIARRADQFFPTRRWKTRRTWRTPRREAKEIGAATVAAPRKLLCLQLDERDLRFLRRRSALDATEDRNIDPARGEG